MSPQNDNIDNPKKTSRAGGPFGQHGGPGGMMAAGGQKARNFKATLRNLLSYMKPYRLTMIAVFVFAIASTIFAIVGPKILGKATTKLFEGIVGKVTHTGVGIDFGYIGNIILLLFGLYIISAVCSYIQGWLMTGVAMKVTYRFRKDISEKIDRLPLKYFDTRTYGEVLSRVTNDVDTVGNTLNQGLSQINHLDNHAYRRAGYDVQHKLDDDAGALTVIPLSLGLIAVVAKASQRYFKQQQEYLGQRERPCRGKVCRA
jgi:ATP-binding cassette subfamily B protein